MRPSPERLELQVRSLASAHETLRTTIYEERNLTAESSRQMIDSVTQLLDSRLGEWVDLNKKLSDDLSALAKDVRDIKLSQVYRLLAFSHFCRQLCVLTIFSYDCVFDVATEGLINFFNCKIGVKMSFLSNLFVLEKYNIKIILKRG